MQRLLSGIQPTGELHIGNYLGAVKNWVLLQGSYQTFYCIVDLHAMTLPYDPNDMSQRTLELAKTLLACGIDPELSVFFVQSHVKEHTELAWILMCLATMGELSRMTQFKEKSSEQKELATAGLFTYPVLQAADILLYKAEVVPVGEDQVQHLEFTRDVCRRFNSRFGEFFPAPRALLSTTPRIMGLDGQTKMSKSRNNHIPLLATPDQIWSLLKGAYTDPARLRRYDPGHPEICNIFTIHHGFSAQELVASIESDCKTAKIGCMDCKKMLAQNMAQNLEPIRERYSSLKDAQVLEILGAGAKKAQVVAKETMAEVRQKLGLLSL
jgi:tryptophanyl-tRNA synthetase